MANEDVIKNDNYTPPFAGVGLDPNQDFGKTFEDATAVEDMGGCTDKDSEYNNILKVRGDRDFLCFSDDYLIKDSEKPSWVGDHLDVEKLRKRIEPWLSSLFQSEHLSLIGWSGSDTCSSLDGYW